MFIAPIARKPYNIVSGFGDAKGYPNLFFAPTDFNNIGSGTYCVDKCPKNLEFFNVLVLFNLVKYLPVLNILPIDFY